MYLIKNRALLIYFSEKNLNYLLLFMSKNHTHTHQKIMLA